MQIRTIGLAGDMTLDTWNGRRQLRKEFQAELGFYSMAESLKEYCHDNFPALEFEQDLKKALQKTRHATDDL